MEDMEELIRQKCAEYDISPDVLTPEEKEQLKKEIVAKQRDGCILDSILYDPEIICRGKK